MFPETDYITGFWLYSEPPKFYEGMLQDMERAKEYIYLETYKFGNDAVGARFKDVLTRKAKEGVTVKIMIDSWGASFDESYFSELISYGGDVRFFRKVVFALDFFTKNHKRNHRKLLLIDDHISYIGSANITGYSLQWRESVLMLRGNITKIFKKTFLESSKIYNKYIFNKFSYKKTISLYDFEIVQDLPSIYRQQIKTKIEKLIRKAKKEIILETPYFLPGYRIRKLLAEASERGVKVTIIMPKHSDVRVVDLLRSKYLGFYYNNNIRMIFYTPNNLHAKLLLIDDQHFGLGSPNFDYRSFRYQHEIMLFGRHVGVMKHIRRHINETLTNCVEFDYMEWSRRPLFEKIFGWLLLPFRHLF